MSIETLIAMAACLLAAAFLYSSVGHAGASGYIAIMTLYGISPAEIKPIALVLNICVSTIASVQFYRAGYFSWRLFWPFAILAIPMAFVGGFITLPAQILKVLVGIVLIFSGLRIFFLKYRELHPNAPSIRVAVPVGGMLGFISGLTGTGGGIFLTPLLLLKGWAATKNASGVSAVFILTNSISGLTGNLSKTKALPSVTFIFILAVLIGGIIGAYLGSRRFSKTTIERLLSIVLLIAGVKLILTG